MDLEGRASRAMARWGPQVRPNPGSSTSLGHEEGAPVSGPVTRVVAISAPRARHLDHAFSAVATSDPGDASRAWRATGREKTRWGAPAATAAPRLTRPG